MHVLRRSSYSTLKDSGGVITSNPDKISSWTVSMNYVRTKTGTLGGVLDPTGSLGVDSSRKGLYLSRRPSKLVYLTFVSLCVRKPEWPGEVPFPPLTCKITIWFVGDPVSTFIPLQRSSLKSWGATFFFLHNQKGLRRIPPSLIWQTPEVVRWPKTPMTNTKTDHTRFRENRFSFCFVRSTETKVEWKTVSYEIWTFVRIDLVRLDDD